MRYHVAAHHVSALHPDTLRAVLVVDLALCRARGVPSVHVPPDHEMYRVVAVQNYVAVRHVSVLPPDIIRPILAVDLALCRESTLSNIVEAPCRS
eukprot:SAG11_NODE_5038_length_1683_cov_1.448864_3_plen_95_part_00